MFFFRRLLSLSRTQTRAGSARASEVIPPHSTSDPPLPDLVPFTVLARRLRRIGSGPLVDEVFSALDDSAVAISGADRAYSFSRPMHVQTQPGCVPEISTSVTRGVNGHLVALGTTVGDILGPSDNLGPVWEAIFTEAPAAIGGLYLEGLRQPLLEARAALEALAYAASRIITDLRNAAEMQRAILPGGTRSRAFFDVHSVMSPCHAVGGDSFEYVDLPLGDFGFAVCDVAGKGAPAALLSGVVQGIFFAESRRGNGPARTLERVNEELTRRAIDSRFATMFYGVLSQDGRLRYCNAGHNPPFLLKGDNAQRLETGGTVLGVFDNVRYQEGTDELEPNDLLVAFSDGVSEAQNTSGEEFGEFRLLSCVREASAADPLTVVESLLRTVRVFCDGASPTDDVTALALRYKARTQ